MATDLEISKTLVNYISNLTHLNSKQVVATLALIKENCTVPFIARYRKEVTGGLDEVQIRSIINFTEEYTTREHRREFILENIKKMGLLNLELENKIRSADSLAHLEDIYAPYKAKKKSKAMMARDAGLLPLAQLILTTKLNLAQLKNEIGNRFYNKEHKIESFEVAFEKAQDIIIEDIAHHLELKSELRDDFWKEATLNSTIKKESDKKIDIEEEDSNPFVKEQKDDISKFQDYFEFAQKISELKSPKVAHRVLAIRRGMILKYLRVEVHYSEEKAIKIITKYFLKEDNLGLTEILLKCFRKAYLQYLSPSLDLEIKTELKQLADESCISVFGKNLKHLLLGPYLGPKATLGVDPGIRTGCKLAVVDNTGKFIVDTVIYPHQPKRETEKSKLVIDAILEKFKVSHIAIGNGTFGRETLEFMENNIKLVKENKVKATLVSEAGASVYSASEIAREEFPDKDPTVRGAISIARRFQDPLAELVKIDAKSIGVGQYQHDVNQAKLKKSLESIVEGCVNYVGVNLNTASAPLLSFVSGIGPALANNIVKYREQNGIFKNRCELLTVPRFTKKIFEQCAGFLRIQGGENILDTTFIHPERYNILELWCKKNNFSLNQLTVDQKVIEKLTNDKEIKVEMGEFTLNDILKSLSAPSQDPRTEFKSTDFRKDMESIKDLKIDEWYPGIITNITAFGAFVDIGLKENGLLHISEMADRFVEDAMAIFKVGQSLKVRVTQIDLIRKRISLSCKLTSKNKNSPINSNTPSPKEGNDPAILHAEIKKNAFNSLKNLKLK